MESFLLADLRKIESALAVGDIEAAKMILYVVITREEAAQQSVHPTGGNVCKICGFPGGYHDMNLHYPKPASG